MNIIGFGLWRIIAAIFFVVIGLCSFPFIFIGLALTTISD